MNSLSQIPGIGPKTITRLKKLKIEKPLDLLYHFPHRYIDFSHKTPISQAQENENITITGKVLNFQNIYTKSHKNLQKATVADKSGQISLIWFNQPYLSKTIKTGETYSFAGAVSLFQNKKTIIAPVHGTYNTGKIIPIYPETNGLSSNWFRKIIQGSLLKITSIKETLPQQILQKYNLLNLKESLNQIHSPEDSLKLIQSRNRLATEEILSLQIKSLLNKEKWLSKKPKTKLKIDSKINQKITKLIDDLPFKLTSSQKQVLEEIKNDLTNPNKITNRLLQGDVGSGKTIIALIACFITHLNNSLSLLIAPTEILAQQHVKTFKKILKPFNIPIFLFTANKKIDFKKIHKNSIVIATHAAIYKKNSLENKVGLLIVDEQHKFGVKQRSFLGSSTNPPHCLTMTATPIPRTISLTMLGNLDLSTIDTLPQNRLKIKTFLVPNNKKNNCYQWIENQIKKTHCQAFIVCPFIEESETMTTVKSAVKEFEILSKQIFPNLKLALIHGKIKPKDKEKIISQFQQNKINILVTTPIIEVGVDIPNSSIIIIQSADRFGLAQLHQLRGRVGRGNAQSYCYLFTESQNEKAINRLKFLEQNHNGLKIAEYDLKSRGPGEAFSIIQHGFPSLKLANLSDLKLINLGQKILTDLTKNYPDYNLSQFLSEPLPEQNNINN